MCKRTIASSCGLFVCFEEGFAFASTDFRIFGDLLLDWWTLTKLRTLEKKIIPKDFSDISIACLQAYIVFWNYEHWISCPVTCSNVSLQSIFPAIELTLTLEFFSLFQLLSLMAAAQNTVYMVLTFAIRKADLSFLPDSKHIWNCFCSA